MSPRLKTAYSRRPDRLRSCLDGLTQVAGHANRVVPIENYTEDLPVPIERESAEALAARFSPSRYPLHCRLWVAGVGAMPVPPSPDSPTPRVKDIRFSLPRPQTGYTPEALPDRTERHNPCSISTPRRHIATHPARSLPPCPSCLRGGIAQGSNSQGRKMENPTCCGLAGDGLFCLSNVRDAYCRGCPPSPTSICQINLCFRAK